MTHKLLAGCKVQLHQLALLSDSAQL